MKTVSLIALGLVLALSFSPAWAAPISSPSGIHRLLRFEWEVGQDRKGRPQIEGYIYNDYMRLANNVVLLVETLDASGQITDRTIGHVSGIVPVFNRTYFIVPLKHAGASYRITVTSYEWRDGG